MIPKEENMKKKFVFILTALMLCLILALSACGGSGTAAGQETTNENENEEEMIDTIYLTIGMHKTTVKLEENAATKALVELLKRGDITYTAHDYGGFEKVGDLGHTLPREDRQLTTEEGDVILYSGNQIVLFYGSNSWSYTKLGKMRGSASEIKAILTESDPVTVTISLQ